MAYDTLNISTDILVGDSAEVLKYIDSESVDLIVTSPPYADQRSSKLLMGNIPKKIC
jgi:DNA modification methylase